MSGSFSFTASDTAGATQNTTSHIVSLTAGQYLTFGTTGVVGASYDGDTLIRLKDPSGNQVASNDDISTGVTGSRLSYTALVTGDYEMIVGCYGAESCSGVVAWTIGAPPPPPGPPGQPEREWWATSTMPVGSAYDSGAGSEESSYWGISFTVYRKIVRRDAAGQLVSYEADPSTTDPYFEWSNTDGGSEASISYVSSGQWSVSLSGTGTLKLYSADESSKHIEASLYQGGNYLTLAWDHVGGGSSYIIPGKTWHNHLKTEEI